MSNDRIAFLNSDGDWANQRVDASRAAAVDETQEAAVTTVRLMLVHAGRGELIVKGENGRIRSKDTIGGGNDPVSIRDREHLDGGRRAGGEASAGPSLLVEGCSAVPLDLLAAFPSFLSSDVYHVSEGFPSMQMFTGALVLLRGSRSNARCGGGLLAGRAGRAQVVTCRLRIGQICGVVG